MLYFTSHLSLSNKVEIVLLVLPIDRFSIEIAGVVDEAIGSVVLRAHVAMDFTVLIVHDLPGMSLLTVSLSL